MAVKAILSFRLPLEEREHSMALRGSEFFSALRAVADHLRSRMKYGELTEPARAELEDVRALLFEQVPDLHE